ncbi:MAG TPA: type II CRISPR RNA-guided endonuclease Cas9 [Saprospiraceae bacterium]|nr:type II CRISPR RNA-guided endonuclease Cas9 [Saprospiraceae bacterium]
MKRILGLDLGTNSIGWALVEENTKNPQENRIIKLGVRVNPLTVDEQTNFEKGKPITTNASRTLARSARRNLQRFKLRREHLMEILKKNKIVADESLFAESGKNTTFETQRLRAKSASERIELDELARVLLLINKKRGYKSSRKVKNDDEGQLIDGMSIAKKLYEENLTPGQYVYQLLISGKRQIPDFYRSDLNAELDKVWNFQKQYYPEILTDEFRKELEGKGQRATYALFWKTYEFNTAENKGSREEKKIQAYRWRNDAISRQLTKEEMAYVITEINNDINKSSGYLGAISDRSKKLYFNKETVGQYLYNQLQRNPHTRLKNQVFYRQDYLDEFEQIWETQSQFHPQMSKGLKEEIRDVIIFFQRKLKSQKGLISLCEFEQKEIEITQEGKTKKKLVGMRVAPKSSPLFQEIKIWQVLNNIELKNEEGKRYLDEDEKQVLFDEVNLKGTITGAKALKLLGQTDKTVKINFKNIEGNKTNQVLYDAYLKILYVEGYEILDLLKVKSNKDEVTLSDLDVSASEIKNMVRSIFETLNIDTEILEFNPELDGKAFEQQKSYQLWHLLYSYEGDNSPSGSETLYRLLNEKFGFSKEQAKIIGAVTFPQDYGSLSSKAMRKIFPYIKEHKYSDACVHAGYNHSKHSLKKEELKNRELKTQLEILPKNALRNPVVEKILNQMINVVNAVVEEYGNLDEIRVELSRELKKNAKEREEMTASINKATIEHEKYRKILQDEYGISMPSRNDLIRYKLYLELEKNAFKDLYTNAKIEKENIFTDKYDIDHVIPQSRFFDDSFSNKVLVPRQANLAKGSMTAIDYMETLGKESEGQFLSVIEDLFTTGAISKAKYEKLKKKGSDIGDGFVERDLRDSQYIAKKAKEILFQITPSVVSTSGSVTAKLREDWDLVNTMKELNLPKYRELGLTEMIENSKGEEKETIIDWTKRNDHRHHAMDALTVAFTTHNHIQYLNYLNARKDENHKQHANIYAIENIITEEIEKKNGKKKRRFKKPMEHFRSDAKKHLEEILISHKAKNKVVTQNINSTKKKVGVNKKQELTPRGQLHKETVYGAKLFLQKKEEKINVKFDQETILKVENKTFRNALLQRLEEFNKDPKKAFAGKNAVSKNPVKINDTENVPEKVTLAWYESGYTIRKPINADNFKDYKNIEKITDEGIKRILKKRLDEFNGNAKEAFSDLEKNPIWLNKDKGIAIKSVTITGVSNAEALHYQKDHFGKEILDEKGKRIPVDFVSTGNNHHVAIYQDADGNLQEQVVSFYEAVERVNQDLPIIDKSLNKDLGWQFQFSMKQNEMFVFPSEDFNPHEIDLLDEKNLKLISKNVFRVQKIATKNYMFRHHLETTVDENKALVGKSFINIRSCNPLLGIIKVRINHLGKIVQIGEY